MIADTTLRPPWRYRLLACALIVPSLVLAGVAAWTLRSDRRAVEADLRERMEEVARRVLKSMTNALSWTGGEVGQGFEMRLDGAGRLAWPVMGEWPPVPGRTGPSSIDARARLSEAHAAWLAGATNAAIEVYGGVLRLVGPNEKTESGLSVAEAALYALLELVDGRVGWLPEGWRADPREAVREVLAVPSTPLAEVAVERFRRLLPELVSQNGSSVPLESLEALFRRRARARGIYAAILERRRNSGENGETWDEVLTVVWDRQFWFALRRPEWVSDSVVPGSAEAVRVAGETVYRLVGWHEVVVAARDAVRALDARGIFGFAVSVNGPGFSVSLEEPSGVLSGAGTTLTAWLPGSLGVTAAVAVVDRVAFFAEQRRRERLLTGMVVSGVGVSVLAAWLTWTVLVRQHRLGVQKTNFVASVSHELRAPLASVRLLADNLEQDRVSDSARRSLTLRLIGRECRRLGVLVDNVLDLSRIERGKKRIEKEPTDVTSLVTETVRWAGVSAEERGVRLLLAMGTGSEGLVAQVDGAALQQAITNLIDNAVKHSPAGEVVQVALSVDDGERGFRVTVQDKGPGIPELERQRIFEPFHRLGSELRREQAGVGIGLAIVKHVVEAHGGRVWVESVEPTGARLVMGIPVS